MERQKYDVAVSYASEQRPYGAVRRTAAVPKNACIL